MEDLKKKFEEVSVNSAIKCGGKRCDMSRCSRAGGFECKGTAMEDTKWTGVRLRVDFSLYQSILPKIQR